MAEDEIMIEDDAIALEDTEDTVNNDADVSNIIPFIMENINVQKIIVIKMKSVGFEHIVIIVVCMGQMYSLQRLKSLASLLK